MKKTTTLMTIIAMIAVLGLATVTFAAVPQLASIMPLVPEVFAQDAPEQSCSPPGLEQSGTSQNPNCSGGAPIPNCVAGYVVGSSGCMNAGTCASTPKAENRPFFETPACPYPPEDP